MKSNNKVGLPTGHWLDIGNSYIIDRETLEEHVRATAAKYAG